VTTRVVNIRTLPPDPRDWPPDHRYIGRGATVGKRGRRGWLAPSDWANPFVIGENGTRSEVIALYERWLSGQPALLARLPELRGLVLVCWCAPERCHGDVLARLADEEDAP
jgi:hypothetical protein